MTESHFYDQETVTTSQARKELEAEGIKKPSVHIVQTFFSFVCVIDERLGTKMWRRKPNFNTLIQEAKTKLNADGYFVQPPARLRNESKAA